MPSAIAMAKPFATSLFLLLLLLSCPSLYPNPQSQHKHLQTSHTCVNYSPLILATLPASIFNTITSYQNFGVSILATKPSLLVVAMPVPFYSARLLATPGAVELDFSLCLCRISISSVTWDGLEATGRWRWWDGEISSQRARGSEARTKKPCRRAQLGFRWRIPGGYDEPKGNKYLRNLIITLIYISIFIIIIAH